MGGGGWGAVLRLGVGVKSRFGSASAWSVKGGFLLLPAMRERKFLTLSRNWRTKEIVVNNTVFISPSMSSVLVLFCFDSSLAVSIPSSTPLHPHKIVSSPYTFATVSLDPIIAWQSGSEGMVLMLRAGSMGSVGRQMAPVVPNIGGLDGGMGGYAPRSQYRCHMLRR